MIVYLFLLKSKSGRPVCVKDLRYGVDVSGCAQIKTQIKLNCSFHNIASCSLHGVIQSRVDNVLFGCSRHLLLELIAWADRDGSTNPSKSFLQGLLDWLQKMKVCFSFIFKCESSIWDMVEILEPLKVGDSDSTSIDVHVRDDQAPGILKYFVSSRGDWSISCFSNDSCLDFTGITLVLSWSWDSSKRYRRRKWEIQFLDMHASLVTKF